jgi:zinc transport system substrate-binding protein
MVMPLLLRRGPWARPRAMGCALSLVVLGGLSGCAGAFSPSAPARRPGPEASGGAPLRVVTTVLPVGLFTQAVAGSCARVEALLPATADLHDLPVSPQLVGRLRGADVLVFNGLGLEAPLEQLLAGSDGPRPRTIMAAAAVDPLPAAEGGHAHGHAHDHDHTTPSTAPASTATAGANPHVWLDPRRAAAQVRAIRDGLAAADPPRAACFRRNAAAYLAELERLDRDLARQLAPYAGRLILSFHDLAPYFAQRYGLRSEAVVDLPEDTPSVADLRRVVDELRRQRLRGLLVDPQNERRSFKALAADLDLVLLPFDPIERASTAEAQRPAHYLEAMRRNGASVVASLRPSAGEAPDLR